MTMFPTLIQVFYRFQTSVELMLTGWSWIGLKSLDAVMCMIVEKLENRFPLILKEPDEILISPIKRAYKWFMLKIQDPFEMCCRSYCCFGRSVKRRCCKHSSIPGFKCVIPMTRPPPQEDYLHMEDFTGLNDSERTAQSQSISPRSSHSHHSRLCYTHRQRRARNSQNVTGSSQQQVVQSPSHNHRPASSVRRIVSSPLATGRADRLSVLLGADNPGASPIMMISFHAFPTITSNQQFFLAGQGFYLTPPSL